MDFVCSNVIPVCHPNLASKYINQFISSADFIAKILLGIAWDFVGCVDSETRQVHSCVLGLRSKRGVYSPIAAAQLVLGPAGGGAVKPRSRLCGSGSAGPALQPQLCGSGSAALAHRTHRRVSLSQSRQLPQPNLFLIVLYGTRPCDARLAEAPIVQVFWSVSGSSSGRRRGAIHQTHSLGLEASI